MAIFVQLNRVETSLPHKRPLLIDNLWSHPATRWVGSFTILLRMEQGLEYRFCDRYTLLLFASIVFATVLFDTFVVVLLLLPIVFKCNEYWVELQT